MPLNTVIVGCGNIAQNYAKSIQGYEEVALTGFSDLDPARAQTFAAEYGGRAYTSLDEVLADPAVELIVNLTIPRAHEEVIGRCLAAGKHVHTEKPFALTYEAANRLAAEADARGLRLSSAPSTWMGEPQQTAAAVLQEGSIGKVRLVFAEVSNGRIEAWHPSPGPFYDVGVLWDTGIYPLTLLTAFLGPVRRVSATERLLYPERVTNEGVPFTITRPEFVLALLDFADGTVARLTCNFYTTATKHGSSVEIHGDKGSLSLGSSFMFNATVESCVTGQPMTPVPIKGTVVEGVEFARGVRELARAMAANRPHGTSAAHAAHVIEIMEAIDRSAAAGGATQTITSEFPQFPLL